MFTNKMRAIHPGEVLREDYLKPLGMSVAALSKALNVAASRINEVVLERRRMTAAPALRLARYLVHESHAQGWLNLQAVYDFKIAQEAAGKKIAKEVKPRHEPEPD